MLTLIVRVSSEGWGRSTVVLTGTKRTSMTVKLVLPLLLLLLSFIMAGGAVRLAGLGPARPLDLATKIHSFGRSVSRSLGLNRRGASFTLLHDTTQHTVFTMLHCQTGHIVLQCHIARVTTQCTLSINLHIVHQTSIYMFAVHRPPLIFAEPNIGD